MKAHISYYTEEKDGKRKQTGTETREDIALVGDYLRACDFWPVLNGKSVFSGLLQTPRDWLTLEGGAVIEVV